MSYDTIAFTQVMNLIGTDKLEKGSREKKEEKHPYFKRPGRSHNRDTCDSCGGGGQIICCDTCSASFHLLCHDPPLEIDDLPLGGWRCQRCKYKDWDNKARKNKKFDPKPLMSSVAARVEVRREERVKYLKAIALKKKRTLQQQHQQQNGGQEDKIDEKEEVGEGDPGPNPVRGFFDEILVQCRAKNPVQFSLPNEYGINIPVELPGRTKPGKKHSAKSGAKPFCIENDNGIISRPTITCFFCSKSARREPMIKCDFCDLYFHLHCLDPPLTTVPSPKIFWACPLHPGHFMEQKFLTSPALSKRKLIWESFKKPIDPVTIKLNFINLCQKNRPFIRKVPCERTMRLSKLTIPSYIKYTYSKSRVFVHKHDEEYNGETNDDESGQLLAIEPPKEGDLNNEEGMEVGESAMRISNSEKSEKAPEKVHKLNPIILEENRIISEIIEASRMDSTTSPNDANLLVFLADAAKLLEATNFDRESAMAMNRLNEDAIKTLAIQKFVEMSKEEQTEFLTKNCPPPVVEENDMEEVKEEPKVDVKPSCSNTAGRRKVIYHSELKRARGKEIDTVFNGLKPPKSMLPVLSLICINSKMKLAFQGRTLKFGKGEMVNCDISKYVDCSCIAELHAIVTYNPVDMQWELLNYSPHGTRVDSIIYGCESGNKKRKAMSLNGMSEREKGFQAFKEMVDEKRKIFQSYNNHFTDRLLGATCNCDPKFTPPEGAVYEGCAIIRKGSRIQMGCVIFYVEELCAIEEDSFIQAI